MTAGRPKTPIAERIARLKGEEQKREVPLPFEWQNPFNQEMQKEAHWAWEFVVRDCLHRQVLANGDRNIVFEYCVMFRRAILAGKEWEAATPEGDPLKLTHVDDMGSRKLHPALKAEESSWDRVRKLGAILGLDPMNRNKPLRVGAAELGIADGTSPATIDLIAFARDRTKPPPWERTEEPAEGAGDGSQPEE